MHACDIAVARRRSSAVGVGSDLNSAFRNTRSSFRATRSRSSIPIDTLEQAKRVHSSTHVAYNARLSMS
jgi:hypothetical protein